jgi:hypothetical protein
MPVHVYLLFGRLHRLSRRCWCEPEEILPQLWLHHQDH